MPSCLKSTIAAAAMAVALPLTASAEDVDVAGVWSVDLAATEAALKERNVSAEELGLAMMVLSESSVVFDDEEDALTFLVDPETVSGVCTYEQAGGGVLKLLECFDGEEAQADPAMFGTLTVYDDLTLSLEDEKFQAWYKKAD